MFGLRDRPRANVLLPRDDASTFPLLLIPINAIYFELVRHRREMQELLIENKNASRIGSNPSPPDLLRAQKIYLGMLRRKLQFETGPNVYSV